MPDKEASQVWDTGTAPHASLAEALAAFQSEVPKMSKDETAKVKSEKANYTYGYAGLDQFVEIVEPVLGKHGLAVTSKSTFTDGVFMLEVSLLHETGERETAFWPLPDPRRVGPQDIGSAMTYGRRYLGWGLTGTFPGGIDDDGKQAQQSARDSWEDARPARPQPDRQAQAGQEPQADPAPPAPKTSWTDTEIHGYQLKIATGELDKAIIGYDWMAGKGLHNKAVESPDGKSHNTATDVMAARLAEEALSLPHAEEIDGIKTIAEARGLLKVQVSESETLDQVIHEARELAAHAAAEAKAATPDPATA
jgi:hypothetical protein